MLQIRKAGVIMHLAERTEEQPNDKEFMDSLFKQFERLMFDTALRYVTASDAEELIQDIIIKFIPKVSTLRKLTRGALSSYIVISVRNTSLNHLRQKGVHNQHVSLESLEETKMDLQDAALSLDDMLIQKERKVEFLRVWDMLQDKDRDLLVGKYILGLNDKELSEMCGCKADSVRMLLTRARRRALDKMKEESFSYD